MVSKSHTTAIAFPFCGVENLAVLYERTTVSRFLALTVMQAT